MAFSELGKPEEVPFNPGEVKVIDGWPRWETQVGPFGLTLDIVGVPKKDSKFGIASFVVMEQEQPFLDYVGNQIAKSIVNHSSERGILLVTAESKGSHLAPWVWHNLATLAGSKLQDRIVILRKGGPKVYMQRPVVGESQEIRSPAVVFRSITSPEEQTLRLSPKDAEYLIETISQGVEPVFVDDFIGKGGTLVATHQLFKQLGLKPPRFTAVVGSDGGLYQETFVQEAIDDLTLLPQPFPLGLPTFVRENEFEPWRINI